VNILVYRNSSLGDFIQAIPSIYFLKKKYEGANIFYLSHLSRINPAPIDDILKNKFLVKEFIFFEGNFRKITNILNLIKLLKSKKINKIYYLSRYSCFQRLVRDFFFFKLVFPFKKINGIFDIKNRYKNETLYLAKKINKKIERADILKINLKNVVKKIKIQKKISESYFLNKKYITISVGGKNISTGSNKKSKKWKMSRWLKLIELILKNYKNLFIVITGTKEELNYFSFNSTILKNTRVINLINKTSVEQLAYLINSSLLHLCHDDGSMHLSALLKKKTLAIYHNHDYENRSNPISKDFFIIRDKNNINNISIYRVYKKVIKILK